MNPTQTVPEGYLVPPRQAHRVLVLLFMLMMFDFIDRQVVSAVLPLIKADWGLSDTQLGTLISIVNVSIALLALAWTETPSARRPLPRINISGIPTSSICNR